MVELLTIKLGFCLCLLGDILKKAKVIAIKEFVVTRAARKNARKCEEYISGIYVLLQN